jgi:hypothetical protein
MPLHQSLGVRNDSRSLPALLTCAISLAVLCASAHSQDVLTYHNNNARTGLRTPPRLPSPSANVNSTSFGKLFILPVDGLVDAEPLYLSAVPIPGRHPQPPHRGHRERLRLRLRRRRRRQLIWQISTLLSGETPLTIAAAARSLRKSESPPLPSSLAPRANGVIYVVAMSKDTSGNYHQRLHALDATTGANSTKVPSTSPPSTPAPATTVPTATSSSIPANTKSAPACSSTGGTGLSCLGLALRRPPLHRMGHGLQRHHARPENSTQRHPQRQRRRHLGRRRRHHLRRQRQHLFSRRQRRLRHHPERERISHQRRLRQRLHPPHHQRRHSPSPTISRWITESRKVTSDTDLGSGGAILLTNLKDSSGNIGNSPPAPAKIATSTSSTAFHGQIQFPPATTSIRNSTESCPAASGPCPPTQWQRLYYGPVNSPILEFQFKNAKLQPLP